MQVSALPVPACWFVCAFAYLFFPFDLLIDCAFVSLFFCLFVCVYLFVVFSRPGPSRLIGVPLACGLTGLCTGLILLCLGIVCFAR